MQKLPDLETEVSSPAPNSPRDIDFCCDQGKDETSNNDEVCLLPDWNWRPMTGVFHSAVKTRYADVNIETWRGRHYSDRLCSDRRYSDNPQSGRPSTSLACLSICRNSRNCEKIVGGRGVASIESTSLIEALRWPRGMGSGEGIPVGSGVPHPPEKLQRTYLQYIIVLSLIFGIWFGVFPIGTARRPIQLQSATQRPTVDCRNSICRNKVCRNSVVYPETCTCKQS